MHTVWWSQLSSTWYSANELSTCDSDSGTKNNNFNIKQDVQQKLTEREMHARPTNSLYWQHTNTKLMLKSFPDSKFTWIIIAAFVCLLKRSSFRAVIPRMPVWIETAEEHNSLYDFLARCIRKSLWILRQEASLLMFSYTWRASSPAINQRRKQRKYMLQNPKR